MDGMEWNGRNGKGAVEWNGMEIGIKERRKYQKNFSGQ